MHKENIVSLSSGSPLPQRLATYSTLALAGACAVGGAASAQAVVVNSGTLNYSVPATASGAYVNTVTFALGTTYASVNGGDATAPAINLWGTSASRAWFYPTSSAVDRFVSNASNAPLELAAGVTIDANSVYGTSTQPTALTTATGAQWTGGTTGYLGFKFLNGAVTEYGWALLSVPTGGPTAANPIRLISLAYENTGAGITTPPITVPEPGSVAALAVGAIGAGSLAWRRRKAA